MNTTANRPHTIKHPKCGGSHGSVAQVRACEVGIATNASGVAGHQSIFDVKGVNPNGTKRTPENNTAATFLAPTTPAVAPVPFAQRLREIEAYVPEGYYAVKATAGVDLEITKFYRVTKPNSGKWKGYCFVSAQASDDFHSLRNPQSRYDVLGAIAADLEAAARLYGQELGKCYRCNRTLTDETSRSLGIGPDCRTK